jgi:hypothetical protein
MRITSIVLAAALGLGTVGIASAQNDGGFGLKGGIGLSSLNYGDPKEGDTYSFDDYKNTMKLGGMLGISYEKRFGDLFALDVEALIANKGVKQKADFTILGSKGNLVVSGNLLTVDVPVSAKFYLGNNVNFYVGPYVSYILGGISRTTIEFNDKKETRDSENWYGDGFKDQNGELPLNRLDLGANLGVEFVTNKGFGVGARLQKGR